MKDVRLQQIAQLGRTIAVGELAEPHRMAEFDPTAYLNMILGLKEAVAALGLTSTLNQIGTIEKELRVIDPTDGPSAMWGVIKPHCIQLGVRFREEVGDTNVYHLDKSERALYEEPTRDWQSVLGKFPSAQNDVQEMNRCLAVGRYTASVFHAMRALESGITALAREFGVSTDMATWKTIIDRTRKAIEAKSMKEGGKWRDADFYSDAATQVWFFKDAWRNHVMHARSTFDEETAPPVIDHTRLFMHHLSKKLSE